MHTEPTQEEISRVVSNLRVRKYVNEASGKHALADCVMPGCHKREHLYVNVETGLWDCKRCSASGNLFTLATEMGIRLREAPRVTGMFTTSRPVVDAPGVTLASTTQAHERLWKDEAGAKVLAYLHERGFDDETIKRFKLCVAYVKSDRGKELGVGIPYIEGDKVTLIKMRNLEADKDKRRFSRVKGGKSGLFNVDGIRACKQVVLVEGELDAVSLWQAGITNVASTSLGGKADVPQEWADALATADDIVLWYDQDETGQRSAAALQDKLGADRCRIVKIPDQLTLAVKERTGKAPKDANDLLRAGLDEEGFKRIITEAEGRKLTTVVDQGHYASLITALIKGEEGSDHGVKLEWENLQNLFRGVRMGEVTIITGHSGHGKTTWSVQMMETLARAGMPVLLGGFENGPFSFARMIFQRMVGRPLNAMSEQEKAVALAMVEKLGQWPIYTIDRQGRHSIEEVMQDVAYAVRRLGVRAVLLDHLHFFKRDTKVEEHQHIENVMKTCVEMAHKLNIHIFMVAHINKGCEEQVIPTGHNLKGSSSILQDTMNGITVWRSKDMQGNEVARKMTVKDSGGRKLVLNVSPTNALVMVWKKRHMDAREGTCLFDFSRKTLSFSPVSINQTHDQDAERKVEPRTSHDHEDPFHAFN